MIRVEPLIAPTHYPNDNETGNYSVVCAEVLTLLRQHGDKDAFWSYPRDVADALMQLKFDGYMLFQLIDIGRQAVRAGIVS